MTAASSTPIRRSPLGAETAGPLAAEAPGALALASAAGVELRELPFVAQVDVRADAPPTLPELPLPETPNTVATGSDGTRALWLSPDEWLLVGPDDAAMTPGDLEARARTAIDTAGAGGSTVDVSAHRTQLQLRGPMARTVLAAGCSIDLHPRAFLVGACAQTLLARVDVILELREEETYRIFVRSSFARYLVDWLTDAFRDIRQEGS